MNRDEKRIRVAAFPPEVFVHDNRRAIYPREPNGGTWLAVNDAGLCLALVNWRTIKREPNGEPESRGRIIPAFAGATEARAVVHRLGAMTLRKSRPFRLFVFDAQPKKIVELRWDVDQLTACHHPWRTEHWFSSGYDEPKAERERGEVCARWHSSLNTSSALKRLHASHLPRRGPFSICMHRPDAATVSNAEVYVSDRRATLRYSAGSPCRNGRSSVKWLALRPEA